MTSPIRAKHLDKICPMCGAEMTSTVLPIKSFSKTGVFAVDSVVEWDCPSGEECESGGGYQSWQAIGRLQDLSHEITERPLFARFNHETTQWEPCEDPNYDLDEDHPIPRDELYQALKGSN